MENVIYFGADNAIRQMLCPHYMFRPHLRSPHLTSDVHSGHWFWTWKTYAHHFHYASWITNEAGSQLHILKHWKRTHLNRTMVTLDLQHPLSFGKCIISHYQSSSSSHNSSSFWKGIWCPWPIGMATMAPAAPGHAGRFLRRASQWIPSARSWAKGCWKSCGSSAGAQLPSGYVKIAIENGHRNSGLSH